MCVFWHFRRGLTTAYGKPLKYIEAICSNGILIWLCLLYATASFLCRLVIEIDFYVFLAHCNIQFCNVQPSGNAQMICHSPLESPDAMLCTWLS